MRRYRPTYAEVDLGAIRSNVDALSGCARPEVRKLAVVKADAYGHGDVEVARACLESGAQWLAVALVEEGVRLREAGIDAPILVLVEATPDAAAQIVTSELVPSVYSRQGAEVLSEAAAVAGRRLAVHVCVDTGMHREGAALEDAADLVAYVAKLRGLELDGIWSHLAVADEQGHPFTPTQVQRFGDVCDAVTRRGVEVPIRHLANSAAIMSAPEAHFDMVRMGVSLYGLYPAPWLRRHCRLTPAMRLVSAVGAVHRLSAGEGVSYGLTYTAPSDVTIASVLIGYADGFARLLSNNSEMLLGGERRRVAGRVTMDQTMIECGNDEVEVGAEVVCLGRQGAEEVTADEIAAAIGTINYEVVCSVSSRVPRSYEG